MRSTNWDDHEVNALLDLFRARILEYIYTCDGSFVESIKSTFSDKNTQQISVMIRSLMQSFSLAIGTKALRNDVIHVDGKEVYPNLHLYETMANIEENKEAGIWHPDELSRLLEKARQYRSFLDTKPDAFFSRIQIWGKSIAECRAKFYMLHNLYNQIKKGQLTAHKSDVERIRLEYLTELFDKVKANTGKSPSEIIPPCRMPNLWLPNDLELLLQWLCDITRDIQTVGHSDRIHQISKRLSRSEQSIVVKLQSMREKYLNKSSYHRAAHLPDCIYDPTSEVHKIFNANWNDPNDPYAVGFLALKHMSNQILAARIRKRKTAYPSRRTKSLRLQHKANARKDNDADSIGSSVGLATRSDAQEKANEEKQPSAFQYTTFVVEIAKKHQWSNETTHKLCLAMNERLSEYLANNLRGFFRTVTNAMPGYQLTEVYFNGNLILSDFAARYGSLDKFAEVALGLTRQGDFTKQKQADTAPTGQIHEVQDKNRMEKDVPASGSRTLDQTAVCCQMPSPVDVSGVISQEVSPKGASLTSIEDRCVSEGKHFDPKPSSFNDETVAESSSQSKLLLHKDSSVDQDQNLSANGNRKSSVERAGTNNQVDQNSKQAVSNNELESFNSISRDTETLSASEKSARCGNATQPQSIQHYTPILERSPESDAGKQNSGDKLPDDEGLSYQDEVSIVSEEVESYYYKGASKRSPQPFYKNKYDDISPITRDSPLSRSYYARGSSNYSVSSDSELSEDNLSDDELSDQENRASHWNELLGEVENRISDWEGKRKRLLEAKQDRERNADADQQWSSALIRSYPSITW